MAGATDDRQNGFWGRRRVLVTGATGVIGAWLVKGLLDRGAEVAALVRDSDPQSELYRSGDIDRVSVVSGRLEDYATLERAVNEYEVQTVFHLGAQALVGVAYRLPVQTFETNVRGTYNLLEACRRYPQFVRGVVVASSDKAYGESSTLPYTEDMPLKGRHPYEVSKSCADLLCQTYQQTYDLPVAIARCGNVYGGGDLNWSRLVPGTVRSLLFRERPVIRSDGAFLRDYVYVEDVARAYVVLAEELESGNDIKGEAFNFSAEQPIGVMEMVQAISELMNSSHIEPDVRDEARGEIRDQYLSSEKARGVLGWRPQFGLDEGLERTISWYERFLGAHRPRASSSPEVTGHASA